MRGCDRPGPWPKAARARVDPYRVAAHGGSSGSVASGRLRRVMIMEVRQLADVGDVAAVQLECRQGPCKGPATRHRRSCVRGGYFFGSGSTSQTLPNSCCFEQLMVCRAFSNIKSGVVCELSHNG